MAIGGTRGFVQIKPRGLLARARGADILRAIESGMLDAGHRFIPVVQSFTPVFTGNLRNSYQLQFRTSPRRLIVTSPLSYAGVMELGRRPGRKWPPFGPILNWVQTKLRPPAKRLLSVVFLVRRKIGMLGIRVPLAHSGLGKMFSRALARVGPRFFQDIISQHVGRLA